METLTKKQIDARAYYAKNSERIKASKRAVYGRKGMSVPKNTTIKKGVKQVPIEKRTQAALSRAEDILDELKARDETVNNSV